MTDRVFNSLGSFAKFCRQQGLSQTAVLYDLADLSAEIVQKKVDNVFGDKDRLAALSPYTIEARGGTDDPLFIDGQLLRASVEKLALSLGPNEAMSGVGSSEPILVYHERGYLNARTGRPVPPRPVFMHGVTEALPVVRAAVVVFAHPGRWVSKRAWSVDSRGTVKM